MAMHKWELSKVAGEWLPLCDGCGVLQGAQASETCYTPKPATPQPPEWKGPLVSDDMWRRFAERIEADVADLEKARQEVCGITDLMRGVSPPADRALEDFTARRKAKRENSPPIFTAEVMDKAIMALYAQPDPTPLARAMSTPLPHDPPMSARLMPWRGKE